MISWIKQTFKNLAYTRYKRVLKYIENLESSIKIESKKDEEIIAEINNLIADRVKRLRRSYVVLGLMYFGIYFSIFSLFFSDVFILSEIADLISKIISFFGTTLFIIGTFLTGKMIELYYQDLNLLTAHLISIFTKNKFKDESLFENENNYSHFINFFKKRGF